VGIVRCRRILRSAFRTCSPDAEALALKTVKMIGRPLTAASVAATVATAAIFQADVPHHPTGEASDIRMIAIIDGDTIRDDCETGQ